MDQNQVLLLHCFDFQKQSASDSVILKGIFKESQQEIQKIGESESSVIWTIDNKYYSVQVSIHSFTSQHTPHWIDIANQANAIIYVFHKDRDESFEELKKAVTMGQQNAEMRLCVAMNQNPDCVISEKTFSLFEDFCIENALELIDLDQELIHSEDEVIKETFGIERVIEALSSHSWVGITVKNQPKPGQQKSGKDGLDDYISQKELDEMKDKIFGKMAPQEGKRQNEKNVNQEDENLDDDLEEQIDMDGAAAFDNALQMLSGLREQSKNLPDEERRKMAAKVALSFLAQMGLDDDEFDE